MQTVRLRIDGMTCQACANRIEKVLNKKPFIHEAAVNFASEDARISFDESAVTIPALIDLIKKTGFDARPDENSFSPQEQHGVPWRLWILLAINLPFLFGMAGMLLGRHEWMLPPWWQFVLAAVVQCWLALPFYRSAWASIKGGLANMDVLVSLGTSAIFLYSTAALLLPHADHRQVHVYFEAGVMVIGFVSLGKYLEHRTKRQSLNSLALLLKLTPGEVTVSRDGYWQRISLDAVRPGDLLRASQGERIAADGTVESGEARSDESHLTGESRQSAKRKGSRVLAGALVDSGSITYRAQSLGRDTLLGDMAAALAEAQGSKAPIARVADKVAGIFVPTVLLISLLTFALTWWLKNSAATALMNAVAVLVIACPCALGLATPAAVMVGMGRAFEHGIWFRDAASLEETARVDTVVLDKTGTLTRGKADIAAIRLMGGQTEDTLLRLAAAVEIHSSHPLAAPIVNAARARGLVLPQVENIRIEVGAGICGDIAELGTVKVGKAAYGAFILPTKHDAIWDIASIVAVSLNGRNIGAFALADTLKDDSVTAVERLHNDGIAIHILSGDRPQVAAHIATQLGISQAQGNVSPRGKADIIDTLKADGAVVAMVGDGVNDAPALAAANVGFAMKDGADIAEHTASATLMQPSLNTLSDALFIARATLRNIRQNLFFAFIYNILGIPLAACGFLSPVIAGAAMALSSVSVLGNALRLKRLKIGAAKTARPAAKPH